MKGVSGLGLDNWIFRDNLDYLEMVRVEELSEENLFRLKEVIDPLKERVDKKVNNINLLMELKELERKHRS